MKCMNCGEDLDGVFDACPHCGKSQKGDAGRASDADRTMEMPAVAVSPRHSVVRSRDVAPSTQEVNDADVTRELPAVAVDGAALDSAVLGADVTRAIPVVASSQVVREYRMGATVEGDVNAGPPEGMVSFEGGSGSASPMSARGESAKAAGPDMTGLDVTAAVFDCPPTLDGGKGSGARAAAGAHAAASTGRHSARAAHARAEELDGEDARADNKSTKIIAVLLLLVALVALCFAGYFGFRLWQQQEDKARETVTVPVSIEAPSFKSLQDLGIPLHVDGIDAQGESITCDQMVSVTSGSLQLKRGKYLVTAQCDVIDAQGRYFEHPSTAVTLVVTQDGYSVEAGPKDSLSGAPQFTFKEIDSTEVKDKQIESVATWMRNFGIADNVIDTLTSTARQLRDQRVAEEAAASDKARAEEEEEARKTEEEKIQAERQAAYDANPTRIQSGETVTLTGTLEQERKTAAQTGQSWAGVWYIIRVPDPLYAGRQSVTRIQIDHGYDGDCDGYESGYPYLSRWHDLVGEVVTVTGTAAQAGSDPHNQTAMVLMGTKLVKKL